MSGAHRCPITVRIDSTVVEPGLIAVCTAGRTDRNRYHEGSKPDEDRRPHRSSGPASYSLSG